MITMKYIINGYHNNYDNDLTITHIIIIIMSWHIHIYTLYLKYHVGPLRVTEMCIIQATIPLWKNQILHFGAPTCNSVLKHSHQCATGMQAGFLTLSVNVVPLDQV